ncbi:hypothetical protein Tco_1140632 [Tanacetum coccineum]
MASMNTRLNIKKLDGNIDSMEYKIKNVFSLRWNRKDHEAEVFQVRARKGTPWYKGGANILVIEVPGQEGAEGNVAGKKKLKESMKANIGKLLKYNAWSTRDREAEVFQVSNDDTAVAQRWLEDKQPEEKTNMDCLVKEREKVHLGIKVGANITVTGVPGQEGAKDNVAEKKKVKESMIANLGKLLKYNAWSTRWSPIRALVSFFTDDEWSSSCVRVAKSVALRIFLWLSISLRAVECISVVCGHTKQLRSVIAYQILLGCFDKVEDEEECLSSQLLLPDLHYRHEVLCFEGAVKPLFFFKAQMIDYCSHAKTGCRINREFVVVDLQSCTRRDYGG